MTTEKATISGFRSLDGIVKFLGSIGKEMTYAYDDLVFVEHSEIILQFIDGKENEFKFFIHQDISEDDRNNIIGFFTENAQKQNLHLIYSGPFRLDEKQETEEIDIVLNP